MVMVDQEFMGKTILLIDDDEALRTTVVQMLEFAGLTVVPSSNALLSLQLLEQQHFDLILTDLMMPEMDGYTLIAELKKKPQTAAIPVIVATGKADPVDQQESLRRGAAAYVVKPFKLETLLRIVQNCLRAAQSD